MPASRTRDDRHIRRARTFILNLQPLDMHAEERLMDQEPTLYAAWRIHDREQTMQYMYEASVMADRPVSDLSEFLAVPKNVLELYETLFFDVRDRLKATGWIMANVLAPLTTHEITPYDPDAFWKGLAYFGGWDVLQVAWSMGSTTASAMAFFNEDIRAKKMLGAAAALHSTKINNFNAVEFVRLHVEQQQHDAQFGQSQAATPLNAAMSRVFESINVTVLKSTARMNAEEPRLQLPGATTIAQAMNIDRDE